MAIHHMTIMPVVLERQISVRNSPFEQKSIHSNNGDFPDGQRRLTHAVPLITSSMARQSQDQTPLADDTTIEFDHQWCFAVVLTQRLLWLMTSSTILLLLASLPHPPTFFHSTSLAAQSVPVYDCYAYK
jgi:hypothetical protein